METKLQEQINKLPVIQKAHIYEPKIEDVAQLAFKAGYTKGVDNREVAGDEEFKAGKKVGTREVVEFVGKNCYLIHDEENKPHVCLDKEAWQAFLKSKGISD